ncbi:MAG: hypothetical protein QM692_14830 [Thermomicrobiales bacterium]
MVQTTAAQAILEQLAHEHRRVVAEWRALILLRRATFARPSDERRWSTLPQRAVELAPMLRQMRHRGEITPITGLRGIYQVTVPYARMGPLEDDEVLMEANPYASFSHLSALVFHGLTNQLPQGPTLMAPLNGAADDLPLGTAAEDWAGIAPVTGRRPARVLGRPVAWHQVKPERFFGTRVYQPRGYPVRVTTPERTLLDGLLEPEWSGGIENVLRAWALARDTLDLDSLMHAVDRFNMPLLGQRAGFLLEELGYEDARFEAWRSKAQRGGSSKLVASAPYEPTFSERWSLSLNAPLTALQEGGW